MDMTVDTVYRQKQSSASKTYVRSLDSCLHKVNNKWFSGVKVM